MRWSNEVLLIHIYGLKRFDIAQQFQNKSFHCHVLVENGGKNVNKKKR